MSKDAPIDFFGLNQNICAAYLLSDPNGPPTTFLLFRPQCTVGVPCRDPLGCPPMPKQGGIGDKASTLIGCTAAALLSLY